MLWNGKGARSSAQHLANAFRQQGVSREGLAHLQGPCLNRQADAGLSKRLGTPPGRGISSLLSSNTAWKVQQKSSLPSAAARPMHSCTSKTAVAGACRMLLGRRISSCCQQRALMSSSLLEHTRRQQPQRPQVPLQRQQRAAAAAYGVASFSQQSDHNDSRNNSSSTIVSSWSGVAGYRSLSSGSSSSTSPGSKQHAPAAAGHGSLPAALGPSSYELAAEKMSDREILATLANHLWPKGGLRSNTCGCRAGSTVGKI